MSVVDTADSRAASAPDGGTDDNRGGPAGTRGSRLSPLERTGTGTRVVIGIALTLALLWTLVPLVWMVLSSLKPSEAINSAEPQWLFNPTLRHYTGLFTGGNELAPYLWHSVAAAGGSAVLSVVLGALAGYGLARSGMRGKRHLSFWIISTRMAPIAAVVLPLFLMFRQVGLIDTLPGLILAYLTFNLPFAIWLLSAFFADVPRALEESARVEGCTNWQAFRYVVLPLTKSGLVTTFVLCLVFAWNDYAFALVFSGPHSQTLPIAASQLVTQSGIDWGQLCAIGTFVVVPMMLAGLAVRRWLVTGLTLGAVTGE